MSSLILSGDTSGTVTVSVPAVAGTNTATLPAATGTVMVSGNMPAFSAWKNASSQSISSGTFTKITFDFEDFDTNNNFASSTFTPTVAGYYQITACANISATSQTVVVVSVYKNGSEYKRFQDLRGLTTSAAQQAGTALVYLNGSTDYVEIYGYSNGTTPSISNGSPNTYFQAVMVRTA